MNGAAPEIDDADGSQSGGGSTETEWTDTDPDDGGTAGEELTGVLDTAAAGSATAEWWARAQGGDDDTGGALESIAAAPLRRRQRRKRRALPSQKCRWRCTRARWVVSTSAALAVATLLHMRGPLRDDVAGRDQQQQHSVSQGLDSSMAQHVMSFVQKLSRNRTVVCTIHQPAPAVFGSFDLLLVTLIITLIIALITLIITLITPCTCCVRQLRSTAGIFRSQTP